MRDVVWRCDWCKEGESHCEEMPRCWVTLVVKTWDGTECMYPEAYISRKVFHFCSEEHRTAFIEWRDL